MATIDAASPPRALSELEDVSDTTSSLGSGDWTDLSSAHPDDVSDTASVDGNPSEPRPVVLAPIDDGSEEAWTTADAMSASSASVYASVHAPPNPFESDGESEHSERSVRPLPYGTCGPLDPFHSDSDSEPSEPPHEMQLILPDPLERSDSTVAADLSFSDAVLATNPAAVVSLAGAHPSVAQRAVVVADVLLAIANATHSSLVRADYYNFTSLSGLPTRVHNRTAPTNEISVLVRDHTNDPLTRSLDGTPSILVVFTSDAHESTVPSIHNHSILIPIVLSESRPVVLFDERDDRPDETAVDMHELVRQLSNMFTFERDSLATIEHAPQPHKSLGSDDKTLDSDAHSLDVLDSVHKSDQAALNQTLVPHPDVSDTDDEPRKPVARKRQPLDRLVGSERADVLRKFHANMGPGLTAACALAVVLSLVLGTGHLIQTSRAVPSPTTKVSNLGTSVAVASSTVHALDPVTVAETSSPHTSLATNSPHTSLAVNSQHTSLAVRSSTTSLAVKSQQTDISVRAPVNESCSTLSVSVSQADSTSLSTIPVSGTSLSTVAATSTTSAASASSANAKARILTEVAEELGNAVERIERALGFNLRNTEAARKVLESVRKSKGAICDDSLYDAVNRANEAIKAASGIDTAEKIKSAKGELHVRHQVARRTAQRQLENLKRGVENLVWGEDGKEDVKGKRKEDEKSSKRKGKANQVKPRPGREKWHTAKDKGFRSERIVKKDKLEEEQEARDGKAKGCTKGCEKKKEKSGKVPLPRREEQERAQTAGRGKRPNAGESESVEVEVEWTWDAEYEYPFGYGPRAMMEEVREYFVF